MTCIAGLVHDDVVYMAGDSAGVSGLDLTIREDDKVFTVDRFAFGFSGSFRMGQILRYKLEIPKTPSKVNHKWMSTAFIDAVRSTLKQGGFAKVVNGEESGGVFLVGVDAKLYAIHGDYQVAMTADGYDAIGCGESYAKGSLFTTRQNPDPISRLQQALEAASRHSAGVRPPFRYVSTAK